MTDWQRLEMVIKYTGLSTNAFAKSIGYDRAEKLYRIERGENGISKKLAHDIATKYCNVNESFLLTGMGQMLKLDDLKVPDNDELIIEDFEMYRIAIEALKGQCKAQEGEINALKKVIEEKEKRIEELERLCLDYSKKGRAM